MNNLVIIKNYNFLWQANLAKNLLMSFKISSVIQTEIVGHSGYPLGGNMNVMVSAKDATKAKQILEDYNSI